MIHNPILHGFNPDPSILRVGDEYYIATSTFEWFPGIALYHSRNLKEWELIGHALTDERQLCLSRLSSAKGVWAPSLTYNHEQKQFYLAYSLMYSHNARYFDLDNFVVVAPAITGPWSDPVYLHSVGFDPSFFHDEDGRSYVVCLQWELRGGEGRPDCIVIQEYDKTQKKLVGELREIWRGGTKRGCLEGPHLFRRGEYYYLFCAEGGTGYGHAVTVARSTSAWGPYEGDPENPILSAAEDFDESDNAEYLKPHRYNPSAPLQKTGHASLVQTQCDEWYLAFLCSRPFLPELRCTLGRETALAKVNWTEDGWLTLVGDGKVPPLEVEQPLLPRAVQPLENPLPACGKTLFSDAWNIHFIAPRRDFRLFASLAQHPGYLCLVGKQSLCSLDLVALVVRRLQAFTAIASTSVSFDPDDWRQSAGLVIYHDNMNFRFLRVTWDEQMQSRVLFLTSVGNGVRKETLCTVLPQKSVVRLGLCVQERALTFYWALGEGPALDEEKDWRMQGEVFDLSELSDEFSTYGEFTGTFVGIACEDFKSHAKTADFAWFSYHHGVLS
jgi:xylan 1,4-beta-xylosidase